MSEVPDRGNLIYINLNPQAGRRPAIVLSPSSFNRVTGFVAICPITSTVRQWGYEVQLPDKLAFEGVILTDQLKNLDWKIRNIQIKGQAPETVVAECLEKINTFLSLY